MKQYERELAMRDAERRNHPHGAIIRTGQRDDQAPGAVDPVPTAPSPTINQSSFGQRVDQRHAGETQDKTLRHMEHRRTPRPTYVGPITTPEPSARVPESERRR
jgi:hypothetical protein